MQINFVDMNGELIDTDKVYQDIDNHVRDIHIINVDGEYYAQPIGLDRERIETVIIGLCVQ